MQDLDLDIKISTTHMRRLFNELTDSKRKYRSLMDYRLVSDVDSPESWLLHQLCTQIFGTFGSQMRTIVGK